MTNDKDKKSSTIILNGTPTAVEAKELSLTEIAKLAGLPSGPNIVYSGTYSRGHGNKPEGILSPTEPVKIKDGMIIDVTATDRS